MIAGALTIVVTHVKQVFYLTLALVTFATSAMTQTIPEELRGKWTIRRELPTSTISCWGESEARSIIGTEIEYTADSFQWKDDIRKNPRVDVAVVTAQQFHDENSGKGSNSSQVSFVQLGIKSASVKQVTIQHDPAKISDATTEIPGDVVLLKSRSTIVFSVCGVFFEANRVVVPSHTK
jgi:hypothetical protein